MSAVYSPRANKNFQKSVIKNILNKKYGYNVDLIDLESMIDGSLRLYENLRIIKQELHIG